MALNSSNGKMSLSWDQYKAITGFNNLTQSNDSISLTVAPSTTGATPANIVFFEQNTLGAGGSKVYDLSTGLTDALSTAINLSRIFGIVVVSTSGDTIYEPDSTNGLAWFLSGTTPKITIVAGSGFMFMTPTPQTVSGTAKRFKLSSTAGSTYKIGFLGGQ